MIPQGAAAENARQRKITSQEAKEIEDDRAMNVPRFFLFSRKQPQLGEWIHLGATSMIILDYLLPGLPDQPP